jgi:hypothetical protein
MISKIIAFHCVPVNIDPAIERFWVALDEELRRRGAQLIVISTCDVADERLNVVRIPFELSDRWFLDEESVDVDASFVSDALDRLVSRWYQVPLSQGSTIRRAASAVIAQLFDTVQPDAVISWQSSHPLSRITREYCVVNDVKWWSAERGWIRDTIMFDLTENNYLSDINLSVAAKRAYAKFVPNDSLSALLKSRSLVHESWGRYTDVEDASERPQYKMETVRQRLGLSEGAPLWVFFSHGEPHVNCRGDAIRRAHKMNAHALNERIAQIAVVVGSMGGRVVVREHPFNKQNGHIMALEKTPFLSHVNISLTELFDQADVGLFTLSTLQFSWALHGKKVGFLCKGMLTADREIPEWSDFNNAVDFASACREEATALRRQQVLENRISFLYQMQLIDVSRPAVETAVCELAGLIL